MYTKNVDTPTSVVTSINKQVGDITISQESLGFDKELAKKADVGHTHDYAGSATVGGPSTSAKKLNTDAGSSTKPVYFKNGMPGATQYEIKASVPKDAQFTDTTYEDISVKKGDLIWMDLDGNGEKQYRVLKLNGSEALCLAMYNSSTSTGWGSSVDIVKIGNEWVSKYQDNALDVYLNTTWYNTLSSTAKSAIVPQTISQDAWYDNSDAGNPDYAGTYGTEVPGKYSYTISKYPGGVVEIGERNVFALSVQDIIDYLSDENMRVDKTEILSNQNIWKMYWDDTIQHYEYAWLRSAQITNDSNPNSNALITNGSFGSISHLSPNYNFGGVVVRPTFNIDLTKIPFTNKKIGLIKLYDNFGNNTDGAMTQAAINNISSTMADKSTVVNKTLLASNWVYGYLLPHKGDLITMDLGNGDNTYRVLKINGNIAECLAMYEASILKYNTTSKTTTIGSTTVQQYANSDLDNYLNTTWYNTLSNAAKAAIVPKVVIQDAWQYWTSLSHTYSGTYGTEVPGTTNYSISKYDGGTLTVGNRNVYAIGVQDVIDYLSDESLRVDTTAILRNVNIWKMFWNTKTQPSSIYYPWLCSAYVGDHTCVSIVSRNKGRLAQSGCSNSNAARPAFQIDLSKISFKGTSAPYRYELSVDGVTKTSNQEIMPADGITDEQMYHLQGANLQDGGQDTNKIVLEAFGVKPSIDIPIKIIMRKD